MKPVEHKPSTDSKPDKVWGTDLAPVSGDELDEINHLFSEYGSYWIKSNPGIKYLN